MRTSQSLRLVTLGTVLHANVGLTNVGGRLWNPMRCSAATKDTAPSTISAWHAAAAAMPAAAVGALAAAAPAVAAAAAAVVMTVIFDGSWARAPLLAVPQRSPAPATRIPFWQSRRAVGRCAA